MTYLHRITFLACRVISVYLLAKWLGTFGSSVVTLWYFPQNMPGMLISVVSMGIPVVIGILLWIFSAKLARFMIKPLADEEKGAEFMSASFDLDTVQVIAFTIMGVFLLVNAIPSLVSTLTLYTVLPGPDLGQVGMEVLSRLVNSVIQILFGIWLVLSSKGLVALLNKIRTVSGR